MSERGRRSPRKAVAQRKQPSHREQILAEIERAYDERQRAWGEQLEFELQDWAAMMALHLQLSELEHLWEALEELP